MPRFSVRQFLEKLGITVTSIKGKPGIAYIDFKGNAAIVFTFFFILGGYTLLLLFISSLGGTPFEQAWTGIPKLALIMLVLFIVGYITTRKRKNESHVAYNEYQAADLNDGPGMLSTRYRGFVSDISNEETAATLEPEILEKE